MAGFVSLFLCSPAQVVGDEPQGLELSEKQKREKEIALQFQGLSASLGSMPRIPHLDRVIQIPDMEQTQDKNVSPPSWNEEIRDLQEDLETI
ncbi:MAG: hypothetical protein JW893_04235 [Candidatus Omnitrophica bacterium]|nr:hypothetical protein [Candidatus Omnitrophota bacterium]